jgi:hypothetical protein
MEFTSNRVRYSFSIGSSQDISAFVERACELISEVTGGLTVLGGTGIWREDGNGQPPYTAAMDSEQATVLTFVVSPQEDPGIEEFKDLIRLAQTETKANISWVNAEIEPVYCDHFRADMPAVGQRETTSHSGDGHVSGDGELTIRE